MELSGGEVRIGAPGRSKFLIFLMILGGLYLVYIFVYNEVYKEIRNLFSNLNLLTQSSDHVIYYLTLYTIFDLFISLFRMYALYSSYEINTAPERDHDLIKPPTILYILKLVAFFSIFITIFALYMFCIALDELPNKAKLGFKYAQSNYTKDLISKQNVDRFQLLYSCCSINTVSWSSIILKEHFNFSTFPSEKDNSIDYNRLITLGSVQDGKFLNKFYSFKNCI